MILNSKNKQSEKIKTPTFPLIILLSIIIIGTIGYDIIWTDTNSTLLDAFYMTIITVTTVGYGEIYPLDTTGRIFTTFIAIFGIGSLFYILSVIMENLFFLQISNYRGQKKVMKKLEELSDHVIIIGMGRVGKLAAKELLGRKKDFIIIDNDVESIEKDDIFKNTIIIEGDATEDEVLKKAGIVKAKGVIVATGNAATTAFVVLSAKVLNPKVYIVARSDDESSNIKLTRIGTDRVVNPYAIGGQRLANLMINKNIVEFFETGIKSEEGSLNIESLELPNNCDIIGKTIREVDFRKKSGATILAIIRNNQPVINPNPDYKIQQNDTLMAFGTREQLKRLEQIAKIS